MTRREQRLATLVGTAVALLVLYQVAGRGVVNPYQRLLSDQQSTAQRKFDLEVMLRGGDGIREAWQAATAATLGADPHAAQRVFREDIGQLLRKHGLEEDLKLRSLPHRTLKNGFAEVPVSISVKGELDEIVDFMCEFYQRPYYAKLTRVKLVGDESSLRSSASVSSTGKKGRKSSRHANREGRGSTKLSVTMTAAALVVPPEKGIPHIEFDWERVGADVPARLAAELDAYGEVVQANFFEKYVKPAEPARPPAETVATTDRPPPPQPPRDPRPDAGNLHLIATMATFGEYTAYVQHDERRDQPPESYSVGDAIDDGTLVLVHPKGMVVRVENGAEVGAQYFYPLGTSFKERERLDPALHSDVMPLLQQARRP
ncbi:MAG: type II secretion system protein M [Planctomycetes bacterium]|nr:type II secretion system protein M [Planctomycetota bacterium]